MFTIITLKMTSVLTAYGSAKLNMLKKLLAIFAREQYLDNTLVCNMRAINVTVHVHAWTDLN